MTYFASFYAHIGAIRYRKALLTLGHEAELMPVPRAISSSCGTCVRYEASAPFLPDHHLDELEQIAALENGVYVIVYRAEAS